MSGKFVESIRSNSGVKSFVRFWITGAVLSGLLFAGGASAETIVMNFDLSQPGGEWVDNYYSGGCGTPLTFFGDTAYSCGGPNYGVAWVGAATLWGSKYGGTRSVAVDMPSPPADLTFSYGMGREGPGATYMNAADGFSDGFSFYYQLPYEEMSATVTVYSGLDKTGDVLATLAISNPTGQYCDPGWLFSCWAPIGVSFSGLAKSVGFSSDYFGYFGFDNVTLGSSTPGGPVIVDVPEPAAAGLFGVGAFIVVLLAGLRRRINTWA